MLQSLASLDVNRETASQYHGGQWSAMYAFASTGTVLPGLVGEIKQCSAKANGKQYIKLMSLYASIAESPTAETIGEYNEFWHRKARDSKGMPVRVRRNGKIKLWKTRPTEFRLPVKYGLRDHFYIDHNNVNEWVLA